MIVYYKRMANAIMLLGAVLGGVFGLIYFHGQILNNPDKTAVFVWALWVFAGVIVGRLLAALGVGVGVRRGSACGQGEHGQDRDGDRLQQG